jgi:anti-sigma28 factor (negative regulator of flagellin synthesis)
MTFEEWLKPDKVREIRDMIHEYSLGEYKMDEWDIVDLMREAWEGRYHTLTYNDL